MHITHKKRVGGTIAVLLLLFGVTAYVLLSCFHKPAAVIRIGAVGDIMIHAGQLSDAWDAETASFDFAPAFAPMSRLMIRQSLMIGNLETTCSGEGFVSGDPMIRGYTGYPLFNTPDTIAKALKGSGFDVIGVANNHALDGGPEGWQRTISVLQEAGLATAGDTTCTYQKVQGLTIAVLAATYGTNGYPAPTGFPSLQYGDDALRQDIRAARKKADLVILMMHDGEEYESAPSEALISRTDAFVADGCDLILVSHAHVPGPIAMRHAGERHGLVLYGLGNFISAQTWTEEHPVHCERGLMASVDVKRDGQLIGLRLYPTVCTHAEQGYQTGILRDAEGLQWFEETVLVDQQYTYKTAEGCYVIDLRQEEE
ncbi:MAG: CapA family protein [Clostridiales bacterium]|nr:CapA family protein [Clostridiales bacterium]